MICRSNLRTVQIKIQLEGYDKDEHQGKDDENKDDNDDAEEEKENNNNNRQAGGSKQGLENKKPLQEPDILIMIISVLESLNHQHEVVEKMKISKLTSRRW
jgi:hypothetical protein